MKSGLAIVIPAYKDLYLEQTLDSIAKQTCKEFTLYIGDDASPYNLYKIVENYESRLEIIYKRFNENLGGIDLVAHWTRCLDMVEDKEWLWLFSDDDVMEANNVELFYNHVKEFPQDDLLHFNVRVVNDKNIQIIENKPFPEKLSTVQFFRYKLKSKINSYVIEYIFRKKIYLYHNKFESFDLGWCADDATWMKFSSEAGISTIKGTHINWRYSSSNISSKIDDKSIIIRKLNATLKFLKWVNAFFSEKSLVDSTSSFDKIKLALSLINNSTFSLKEKFRLAMWSIKESRYSNIKPMVIAYVLYMYVKEKLKHKKYLF